MCAKDSKKHLTSKDSIKTEIMQNGPVVAKIDVYVDFTEYISGIYYQASNVFIQKMTVKIVGWGYENGILYWICQ